MMVYGGIEDVPCDDGVCYLDMWLHNEQGNLLNEFIDVMKNKNSTHEEITAKWNEIETKFLQWCENQNVKGEF